jgi:hypothetical protein
VQAHGAAVAFPALRHRPAPTALHRDAPACTTGARPDGHGAAVVHARTIQRPSRTSVRRPRARLPRPDPAWSQPLPPTRARHQAGQHNDRAWPSGPRGFQAVSGPLIRAAPLRSAASAKRHNSRASRHDRSAGRSDDGRLSGAWAAASTEMLLARDGHTSTPSLVRTPRCDSDGLMYMSHASTSGRQLSARTLAVTESERPASATTRHSAHIADSARLVIGQVMLVNARRISGSAPPGSPGAPLMSPCTIRIPQHKRPTSQSIRPTPHPARLVGRVGLLPPVSAQYEN